MLTKRDTTLLYFFFLALQRGRDMDAVAAARDRVGAAAASMFERSPVSEGQMAVDLFHFLFDGAAAADWFRPYVEQFR